jgi:hypothetical protein
MSDQSDDDSGFSQNDIQASLDRIKAQQAQDQADAQQQQALLMRETSSRPQSGGIGSFLQSTGNSMNMYRSMAPAASSGGAAGFAGASAPAFGAGTGEGATGLYGLGGMSEMAGGAGGSGIFTVTGAGGGAGAAGGGIAAGGGGSAATGGLGSAASAAGPWAALAAVILAQNQWAKGKGLRNNESFPLETGITQQAPAKDASWYAPRMDKVIPGWGTDAKVWGDLSSFRVGSALDAWKNNPLGAVGGIIGLGKDK